MSQMGRFFSGTDGDSIQTITGNSGGAVGPNLSGNVDVLGDGVTVDVVGTPGSNLLTISAMGVVSTQFDTDDGSAVPAANILDVLGGTNMNTAGATNVVTINLDDDVTLAGFLTTIDGDVTVGNQAANTTGPHLDFRKDQAGAVIVTGDDLGTITFTGYDGSDYITGASITSRSSGTIATDRVAGDLSFFTSPDSITSEQERMTINPTGTVVISAPDSGTALTVSGGGLNATGTITFPSLTNGVLEVDGSGIVSASTLTEYVLPIGGASGSIQSLADGVGTAGLALVANGAGMEPTWQAVGAAGAMTDFLVSTGTSPVVPDGSGQVTLTDGDNITFTGGTNELTAAVSGTTDHGIQIGNAAGSLTSLAVGTDGQVLIGATGADAAFATITSSNSTIDFTLGANTLNLETAATIATSYETDSGTAQPALGVISIDGGTNINTAGATDTVTVNLDDAISLATSVTSPLYTVSSGDLVLNMTDDAGTNAVSFTNDSDAEVAYVDSLGAASFATNLDIDNLNMSGNTLSSTDTNGNITLDPDGAGVVTISYLTQYELVVGGSGGEVASLADGVGTSGQVLTSGGAGAEPTWEDSAAGGITWNVETTTPVTCAVNNGYFANYAGTLAFTLPTTAAVGDTIEICQMAAGQGWTLAVNTGETIYIGNTNTTITTGTLASTDDGDWVELVCRVANTDWACNVKSGNITVT